MRKLLEVSQALADAPDMGAFLNTLITVCAELTGCEIASILEQEEDGQQLRFLAVPWFYREALQTLKVPLDASIAGRAIQTGKPVIVPDAAADAGHFKGIDQAAGFTTRSLASAPIVYQDEALGALETINKVADAPFTEEDVEVLTALASYAAVAIHTTRLVRKSEKVVDEMNRLDRMKSEFIAIASHELRTPLGLILGHSTFLREVIQLEHRPEMEIIVRNAIRLKEIVENISNIDNVQRGMATLRRRVFSMKRAIEEVRDSFYQETLKKRLSLRIETGKDPLMVEGDADKITIALSNLVKNAVTFTNAGGHILIAAETMPGYVKVSVIDDGIGIPPKDLPHIFERFYQVETHLTRKHGGMGLGLSVAKVMIEMHGGRIWAESIEGKGSNFTFILPLSPSEPVPA
jgi:signal transduction histidine kinase